MAEKKGIEGSGREVGGRKMPRANSIETVLGGRGERDESAEGGSKNFSLSKVNLNSSDYSSVRKLQFYRVRKNWRTRHSHYLPTKQTFY